MNDKLNDLRESISDCLSYEKAYDLVSTCKKYGLDGGEDKEAWEGKFKYVQTRLQHKDETFLIELAKKLLKDYESPRIGYSLNKYLDFQYYQLTEITRQKIIDKLKKMKSISGSMSQNDFLKKVNLSYYSSINDFDWYSNQSEKKNPIQKILDSKHLCEILDSQFFNFIEWIVHPTIRDDESILEYLEIINPILDIDSFELVPTSYISGRPIYKVIEKNGVKGNIKNLIFAANGYKPDIVINDSLNNDITIVKNGEFCLIYDKPIKQTGLKWVDLVHWWSELTNSKKDSELAKRLFDRLLLSLDSKPEKDFFRIYYNSYSKKYGKDLPALIPQVYLHYDPYTIKKHGVQYLTRQRMDFLMLFSNSKRVVIEIDGKQHYSESGKASPKLYSEMVRLDRELKFLNYDVYRIGGYELTYDVENTTRIFFDSLFEKYL